ncbi:hypothetical protein [Alcanivorax sp.]|uniref:hypothetical protein n=1 Tax=Alcanivorax sp. TaxID=1872427 RepID=UPI00199135F1|nr:hypothetical protein [Alcanivorax sp.]MBD3643538.1 hypothetical protein [Alcanivorax sp.]
MRILSAVIAFNDSGKIHKCDAILHKGVLCLVPSWLHYPDEGYVKPEMLIRLTGAQYQKTDNPAFGDYLVNTQLPRSVLEGQIPSELADVLSVENLPDVKIQSGGVQ